MRPVIINRYNHRQDRRFLLDRLTATNCDVLISPVDTNVINLITSFRFYIVRKLANEFRSKLLELLFISVCVTTKCSTAWCYTIILADGFGIGIPESIDEIFDVCRSIFVLCPNVHNHFCVLGGTRGWPLRWGLYDSGDVLV